MPSPTIPPWPSFDAQEIDAVAAVLRSNRVNYWTGDIGRAFETDFARFAGTEKAVAVANGTLALDLAIKALGIGPGDEVVVTPRSFMASVSTVVTAGATPVFADVDADSGNLTAQSIAAVLSARTKAIIPVHLAGWPCAMPEIMALAEAHRLVVIEDCAQAHGARIDGRSVGSFGQVGAWSFCQDKIMTTGGEGGMVTTDDHDLWGRMWSYKDHGKSWAAVYERAHPPGFRWVHDSFGTNWRMLEMQAAIGRIQLTRMAHWSERRRAIAAALRDTLARYSGAVRVPVPAAGYEHAYYRLYAYVRPEGLKAGWNRDRIVAEVTARGVPMFQGSCSEIWRERAFDGTGWQPLRPLPVAAELGATSLAMLTHPTIDDAFLVHAQAVLTEVFDQAAA